MVTVTAAEFERVSDLLDAYFEALGAYNRALGSASLSRIDLADAARREASGYARVRSLKERLAAQGIAV